MYLAAIDELKLIIGWSPKSACTSLKAGLMSHLNIPHSIEFIHLDFNKNFRFSTNKDYSNYTKICIVRDPVERFISGVINKCVDLPLPLNYLTTRNFLSMIQDYEIYKSSHFQDDMFFCPIIKHHFTEQYIDYDFDYIFNVKSGLNRIFQFISKEKDIPEVLFENLNSTQYKTENTNVFYGDLPFTNIKKIVLSGPISKNKDLWLKPYMEDAIKNMYKKDYDLLDQAIEV